METETETLATGLTVHELRDLPVGTVVEDCDGEQYPTCCPEVDPHTDWGLTPDALAGWERDMLASGAFDPARSTVATDAQTLVYGDRNDGYGHPRDNMTRTAIIWTGLLQDKLVDGAFIAPEDVARCMVGLKLSRDVSAPLRDNRVDGIGYLIALDRLETGR